MEKIKVLGIDPSLRKTGLAIVTYNTELENGDPKQFEVSNCNVLVNPQKFKGTDAIMNMIDMMMELKRDFSSYSEVDDIIIESPAAIFNKAWSAGTMALIAHVSGAAIPIFGIEKSHIFKPIEWNRGKKKEITHRKTIDILGDPGTWHYTERVKDPNLEHVLDAASMALWWIKINYIES